MRDTELRAQLMRLGMPASKADDVTRQIRDVLHPVAATAAAKMRDHQNALEQFVTYGDAGLSGYEFDGVSGLLKSVKKVAKKAIGVVGKVAAVAAPILPAAAVVAVGAQVVKGKSSGNKYMKSGKAAGSVSYNTMTAQQLQDEAARLQTMIAAGKDKKDASKKLANVQAMLNSAGIPAALPAQPITPAPVTATSPASIVPKGKRARLASSPKTPPQQIMNDPTVPPVVEAKDAASENLSERIGKYRHVRVPKPIADVSGQVAAQAVQQGYPADPAALMQALLANQGTNMVSPAAQDVVRTVATQGVEQTPEGPSALPKWALPAGLAALGLLIVVSRRK